MMDGMKVLMSLRSSARQAAGLRIRRGASDSLSAPIRPRPLRIYTRRNFEQIRQLRCLSEEQRFAIRVVTQVLPFRVNQYVIDHLIEWDDVPNDPMELNNRADQHPDRVARMSAQVLAWQATLPEGPIDPTAGSNAYPWPGRG